MLIADPRQTKEFEQLKKCRFVLPNTGVRKVSLPKMVLWPCLALNPTFSKWMTEYKV
jgi:hypothetical protein